MGDLLMHGALLAAVLAFIVLYEVKRREINFWQDTVVHLRLIVIQHEEKAQKEAELRFFAENERDEAREALSDMISERDELLMRLLHQESALEVEPMSEKDADEILESQKRALETRTDFIKALDDVADLDLSDPRWDDLYLGGPRPLDDDRHEKGVEL